MLSVVIPAFNESEMLLKSSEVINRILKQNNILCELVYVDDGSSDDTWKKIEEAAKCHTNVRGVKFSRNFGKEAAIMAGLAEARGDCCAVIDCDLQHPPETLVEMYRLWEQGYEVIEGVKSDRGNEGALHRLFAKFFYFLVSKATGFDMQNMSDFKLLDRKVVDSILELHEKKAFFRAMSSWVGFKTAKVEFEVQEREAGVSKWSTANLTKYAIRNITSFSAAPMQIVTVFGFIMLAVSVVFSIISIIQKISGIAVAGFTTVILLVAFSSSIIMISIGIVGYYISRIFDEVKNRPTYIISEICEEKEE